MRLALLSAFGLVGFAAAATREFWWNVEYAQANPDGLYERQVIGVNGSWPPPPIEVNKNDKILLHVHNGLPDQATSIHHHGMWLKDYTEYDGTVGVTQCGSSFDYIVPTDGLVGTYWVHAHYNGQYVDGLRAPLIIHNPHEAYQYDEEFTVILGDWYHQQHSVLVQQFMNVNNPDGVEPIPDSALMYFSQNGAYFPGFNENASLQFQPGKTYRIRVINTSAFALFWFWIDGHDLRMIEVDGLDIRETPVTMQSLSVAQRYSFLVTARDDSNAKNYSIHANMDPSMFDYVPDGLQLNVTSTITYPGASHLSPSSLAQNYQNTIDDINLRPLLSQFIGKPDNVITLNANFATFDNGINRASFNNVTYNSPLVPSYMSAVSLGQKNPAWYGPTASVITLGQTVELFVRNYDAGAHPFHLHGHKFAIVWKTTDFTSTDPKIYPPVPTTVANPMYRDTEMIPPGGAVRLRFVANNPGAWFFHCHIDWHLTAGLAWTLIEGPVNLKNKPSQRPPQDFYSQCASQGFPTSGNAAGHTDSATDYTGWQLGPYPVQ